MARKILFIFMIAALPFVNARGQAADTLHKSHYSLSLGVGWSHYFNSLEIGPDNVSPDFASFDFKFFWEPGYRISLGLETGYYRVYRYKAGEKGDNAVIDYNVVPLLLVARMRVIDRVYLSAGTGLAYMRNSIEAGGEKMVQNIWSLSNYQFSGSYIYPLGKRFRIAGEAGTLYIGKSDDWLLYLEGVVSVVL